MSAQLFTRSQKHKVFAIFFILLIGVSSCATLSSDDVCENVDSFEIKKSAQIFFKKWFGNSSIVKWNTPIEMLIVIQGYDKVQHISLLEEVVRLAAEQISEIIPAKITISDQIYAANFILNVGLPVDLVSYSQYIRQIDQWRNGLVRDKDIMVSNFSAMGGAVKIQLLTDRQRGEIVAAHCHIIDRKQSEDIVIRTLKYATQVCIFGSMALGTPSLYSDHDVKLAISILYNDKIKSGKPIIEQEKVILKIIEHQICINERRNR